MKDANIMDPFKYTVLVVLPSTLHLLRDGCGPIPTWWKQSKSIWKSHHFSSVHKWVLEGLSCQGLSWGFHARNFSLLVGIYWPVTSMGGPWALVHKATLKTPGPFWTAGSFYDIPTSLILRQQETWSMKLYPWLPRPRCFPRAQILQSLSLYKSLTHVCSHRFFPPPPAPNSSGQKALF